MVYVALLRGINVGGNNKINMKELKVVFEQLNLKNVITYINSGNIIFKDSSYTESEMSHMIEQAIEKTFGFKIKVLIRSLVNYEGVMEALPDTWVNDKVMKSDVLFLWEDIDMDKVSEMLVAREGIDESKFIDGAILWSVSKENTTKSGMLKIVGTSIYKKMTIRNVNTTRKIYELMKSIDSE